MAPWTNGVRATNPHFSAEGGTEVSSSVVWSCCLLCYSSTIGQTGGIAGSSGVDHQLRASRVVFVQLPGVTQWSVGIQLPVGSHADYCLVIVVQRRIDLMHGLRTDML